MTRAAAAYLGTLSAADRDRGTWALDDEFRYDWHFVPRERQGVRLKDMSPDQRAAAHRLLRSVLSAQGYLKATGVMQLEGILGALEGRPERRDREDYYVQIFGQPAADGPWAWRYEGHHLSLNFTAAPDHAPSVTPAFIGSNPNVVPSGPAAGWNLLGEEESLARELVRSLDAAQRTRAILSDEAPDDIITGNARRVELTEPEGLPASELRPDQLELLMRLMGEYLGNVQLPVAEAQWSRIMQTGIGELRFAWAGGTDPGQGHYYRIHGPTVFIEYDNTQSDANHVHSVWRDPQNDFGEDLLRLHYENADHHQDAPRRH